MYREKPLYILPPSFSLLNYNLKGRYVWNSVEVHAIYALIYLLCMNQNGILFFREYLACTDQQIFEPYFIAQYLLSPMNTIVQSSLLPWMMKPYLKYSDFKYQARKGKTDVFLKYTIMIKLMNITNSMEETHTTTLTWMKD